VGVEAEGSPLVLPMAYGRAGDVLYLHGAAGNHLVRSLGRGAPACVTVTLVDGVVLARSAFHHSINYRSVVLFGRATLVTDDDEKRAALDVILDHVVPGRAADARPPSPPELRATAVVRFGIVEGSAKIRAGGPLDDPEDLERPVWAGHVPLRQVAGPPIPDGPSPHAAPAYAQSYRRGRDEA
jgi:nitroimidazol reductase NimA-like FMN-containing flavoprotein (pyridoxamine 5'-phosphate oxidase superfamily)